MNLTLVAHYGPKLAPLRTFIQDAQAALERLLPTTFEPYCEAQVHGTIIGLEGIRQGDCIVNQNYWEQQKCLKVIDFPKLFEILRASNLFPFTVQIGGFDPSKDYSFSSRGQHPSLRSFSVQGAIAVAMGWPNSGDHYPLTLDQLRRSLNDASILHKYHASPTDVDNDFFFVLGRINRDSVSDGLIQVAQEHMRAYFEQQPPFLVPIDRNSLRVVAYSDTRLPWGDCQVFTLDEAEANLPQLLSLYQG